MRFWGINAGVSARIARFAAVAVAATIAGGTAASDAHAADPTVAPYGQVAAVGSLDTSAVYGLDSTSGLTDGDFVDPVGMAATADPSVPGGEDVYVLDLVNPQAMNALIAQTADPTSLMLEYRLQKIAITPSATNGSDAGGETVLACTTFQLQSSTTAPDERAVSLAVDRSLNAVDVLVNAMPDHAGSPSNFSIAEQVDQWTTSLESGAGPCPETPIPKVAVPSSALVKAHDPGLAGDIDGDSIAFAGTGPSDQLALGGSKYLNHVADGQIPSTEPIIERFTAGGDVSGTWTNAEGAANALARSGPINGKQSANGWGIDQTSTDKSSLNDGSGKGDTLYGLSANPDGSLNVTLGPHEYALEGEYQGLGNGADYEPIMAKVSADLSTTTPLLPSPQTSPTYNYPAGWTAADGVPPAGDVNSEVAATDALAQDTGDGGQFQASPAGGTQDGGTLAPSVVALGGDGSSFPDGLYAGFVADDLGGTDTNLDQNGEPLPEPAWVVPNSNVSGTSANIGVRIFTGCTSGGACTSGDPVGMIGNAGPGPCSVRSGAYAFAQQDALESTLALAAGSNGTIYALAQPDLDSAGDASITPLHPVSGANVGDILFEFKPGAGSDGNPGSACPQPSGNFSVTDVSDPSATPDTGSGAVPVLAGASIQFDASPLDLQGGVAWSYTWDSPAGQAGNQTGGATFCPDLTPSATFCPDQVNAVYDRPNPSQTFVYTTPGQSTATLQMQSDFGLTTISRSIDVIAPGQITAQFAPAGGAVANQPTTLDATGTSVASPDSIVDYHWDFGDGTSDETAGPVETWTFPSAGTYSVTLTAIDQLGRTQTATEQVSVAPPPPAQGSGSTTSTPAPSARTAHRFSVSPKLRSVRSNADLSAKVSCPAGDRTCAGTIAVLTAGKVSVPGRKGKKLLSLGKGTFSVTAGHSKTMLIKLAAVTQKLISPQQPLKLAVVVVAHDTAGAHAIQRVPLYLFPPRKSRPRKFG